jgi:noranthrone monooxygenase
VQGPAISIATGLIYSYAAYSKSQNGEKWRGFAIAGATTISMIPYTWIVMQRTNNKLWAAVRGESKETVSNAEAQGMLNTWSRLNMVRAMFPLAGGVLGLLSVLKVLNW